MDKSSHMKFNATRQVKQLLDRQFPKTYGYKQMSYNVTLYTYMTETDFDIMDMFVDVSSLLSCQYQLKTLI